MVHLSLALVQAQGPEQVPGLGPVAVQVPVQALVQAQVEVAALAQVLQLQRLPLPAGAVPFLEAGPALPLGKAPEVAQLFRLPGRVQARARAAAQVLGTAPAPAPVPVLVLAQGKVLVQAPVRARVPAQAQVPVPAQAQVPVQALGNLHRRYFPGTPQRPQ